MGVPPFRAVLQVDFQRISSVARRPRTVVEHSHARAARTLHP